MRNEELAWAAGIFEGEGCFWMNAANGKSKPARRFFAGVQMCDFDIIKRFALVMGFGVVRPVKRKVQITPQLAWRSVGFNQFKNTIILLEPWLGIRRRARAKELLALAEIYYSEKKVGRGRPRKAA